MCSEGRWSQLPDNSPGAETVAVANLFSAGAVYHGEAGRPLKMHACFQEPDLWPWRPLLYSCAGAEQGETALLDQKLWRGNVAFWCMLKNPPLNHWVDHTNRAKVLNVSYFKKWYSSRERSREMTSLLIGNHCQLIKGIWLMLRATYNH